MLKEAVRYRAEERRRGAQRDSDTPQRFNAMTMRQFACSVLLALCVVATSAVASAQQTTDYGVVRDPYFEPLSRASAESGFYPGGAYRVEVPTGWHVGVVLLAPRRRG